MKGTIEHLNIGGRACSLYLPPEYASGRRYPAVYINGTDELGDILEILEPHFEKVCAPCMVLNVDTVNWNDDMTPWPAPGLIKKNGDFSGHADAYLGALVKEIKPYVDTQYKTKPEPENTGIIGYSLGGLTALYALYTCGAFGKVGCLSGSLWYDGWLDFMESHLPVNTGARIYLSLGRKEEESKNARMAAVGRCTMKASELLRDQLDDASHLEFEWNDGGHFTEIPQRYLRAFMWLMKLE